MHWVVFDYGEVISRRTRRLPDLAALVGADPVAFEAAYWLERDAYDRGQPDLEYWQKVAAHVGVAVDEPLSDRLTETDVRGWLELDPATIELLGELGDAGVPLALLSNAPVSFGRAVRQTDWSARFRHLVFSGDLGVAKPDAEIWAALLDQLSARAADCVFLDDRQVNVDGAITSGLAAVRWTGAHDARRRLAELGITTGSGTVP